MRAKAWFEKGLIYLVLAAGESLACCRWCGSSAVR